MTATDLETYLVLDEKSEKKNEILKEEHYYLPLVLISYIHHNWQLSI
jgi:hypothetical protein